MSRQSLKLTAPLSPLPSLSLSPSTRSRRQTSTIDAGAASLILRNHSSFILGDELDVANDVNR